MQNLRNIAIARAKLNQTVRNFFNKNGFLEVETPILTQTPGMEPHLTPFETKLKLPAHLQLLTKLQNADVKKNPRKQHPDPNEASILTFHLNHSPELYMKRLLGHKNSVDATDDFDKIFQITKVFRNGEIGGPNHHPEFTMLEWYRKNADYNDLMKDCENLITTLTQTFAGNAGHGNLREIPTTYPEFCTDNVRTKSQNENIHRQGTYTRPDSTEAVTKMTVQRGGSYEVDTPQAGISQQFPRISTRELFLKYTGIDLLKNRTAPKFRKTAKQNGHDVSKCRDWDDIFFKIFLNEIEPNLPKTPIFIIDYPASQAALARLKKDEPFFAERFELYINGIEICNAFSELIDPKEQHTRLIKEQKQRKKMCKPVFPIDEEFLKALGNIQDSGKTAESGLPPQAAGIALGMDRLLMILLNKNDINDVLLFPLQLDK